MIAVSDVSAMVREYARQGRPVGCVIPVYNHARTVVDVAMAVASLGIPVWVVNDGSTDATAERLAELQGRAGIVLCCHERNQGKGAAILTGMKAAAAVCVGHDRCGWSTRPTRHGGLMGALEPTDCAIAIGRRTGWWGEVSRGRAGSEKVFNFWVYVSGGPRVEDSQSGYRMYPIGEICDCRWLREGTSSKWKCWFVLRGIEWGSSRARGLFATWRACIALCPVADFAQQTPFLA
jgi:glycosyltransferase involved in cell wall biosynthesis